jgi:hypothetical protein
VVGCAAIGGINVAKASSCSHSVHRLLVTVLLLGSALGAELGAAHLSSTAAVSRAAVQWRDALTTRDVVHALLGMASARLATLHQLASGGQAPSCVTRDVSGLQLAQAALLARSHRYSCAHCSVVRELLLSDQWPSFSDLHPTAHTLTQDAQCMSSPPVVPPECAAGCLAPDAPQPLARAHLASHYYRGFCGPVPMWRTHTTAQWLCCSVLLLPTVPTHCSTATLCCSVCTVTHGHCIPSPSLLPISLPLQYGSMRSSPASPARFTVDAAVVVLLMACTTAVFSRVSIEQPSTHSTSEHLTCAVQSASPVNLLLLVLWVKLFVEPGVAPLYARFAYCSCCDAAVGESPALFPPLQLPAHVCTHACTAAQCLHNSSKCTSCTVKLL